MYHCLDTDIHVLLGFEWQEPTGSCPAAGMACHPTREPPEDMGACRQEPPELTRLFVAIPVPIGPLESLLHKFEADIIRVLRNVSHMTNAALVFCSSWPLVSAWHVHQCYCLQQPCCMAVVKPVPRLLSHLVISLHACQSAATDPQLPCAQSGQEQHKYEQLLLRGHSHCCSHVVHRQSQHHQDRPCLVVLLQAPSCPVHNQSSIITNSTRTRAGVLIECLDDVALPLIRETLLKNPPEFMLSPQGAHCMLCMLYSMLLAALAAVTGHSIMREIVLKNGLDLVLLPQGK